MRMTMFRFLLRFAIVTSIMYTCLECGSSLKLAQWREEGEQPFADSISVFLHLNDTLFFQKDLTTFFRVDSVYTPGGYKRTSELRPRNLEHRQQQSHIPILSVDIENLSDSDLCIMMYGLIVLPTSTVSPRDKSSWRYWSEFAQVFYEIGKQGNQEPLSSPSHSGFFELYQDRASSYGRIAPHERLRYVDSVGILTRFGAEACLPGRYWVVVKIRNYWQKELKCRLWTGERISDTLWYSVLPDSSEERP